MQPRILKAKIEALGWCTAILLFASPAAAIKYMSLERAVKTFMPKEAKIVKVTKRLTAEQSARLVSDYGWKPTKDRYSFYVGRDKNGEALAYVFLVSEQFNTCFHKYAVGLTSSGQVIETAVVELSCPRALPIKKKSFLHQFKDKAHTAPLTTKVDIQAVTGATLSSEVSAQATRKAVSLHNLFFGGGQPVEVSAETRSGRESGARMILQTVGSPPTKPSP